jgi:hypothetical protein
MKFVEHSIGMQCLHESLSITVIVKGKVNCKVSIQELLWKRAECKELCSPK